MSYPTKTSTNVWITLMRTHHLLLGKVEAALKHADLPPLGWYDILYELEKAGTDGLRPHELETRSLLPQYGISRLIARVEKAGYLQREACPNDKRSCILTLTDSGQEIRTAMWDIYGPLIEETIGDNLTSWQARQIVAYLENLAG